MEYNINSDWNRLEIKVVKPVWNLYKITYKNLGLEYGDFVGISYIILRDEILKANTEKSSIYTFATNILKRRMCDYIRNNYKTNKTRANAEALSLNIFVSEEGNVELVDAIVDEDSEEKYDTNYKVQKYLTKLTKVQKQIADLIMAGCSQEYIQNTIGLSDRRYNAIIQRMKSKARNLK